MAKLAPGIVADGVANRLSERVRRLGPFLALSKQRHSLGREGSIPEDCLRILPPKSLKSGL